MLSGLPENHLSAPTRHLACSLCECITWSESCLSTPPNRLTLISNPQQVATERHKKEEMPLMPVTHHTKSCAIICPSLMTNIDVNLFINRTPGIPSFDASLQYTFSGSVHSLPPGLLGTPIKRECRICSFAQGNLHYASCCDKILVVEVQKKRRFWGC